MRTDYRAELEVSPLLTPDQANYYMSLIGILRWAVELGRLDIYVDVTLLSSYMAQPRVGHMEQVLHIFAYLKCHLQSNLVFDPNEIKIGIKNSLISMIGHHSIITHRRQYHQMPQNHEDTRYRLMRFAIQTMQEIK
jgi:hypothetical protein